MLSATLKKRGHALVLSLQEPVEIKKEGLKKGERIPTKEELEEYYPEEGEKGFEICEIRDKELNLP